MSKPKSPWNKNEEKSSHFSFGILLWLGFLVFVVLLLWSLFIFFSHQSSTEEDVYLKLVQHVGILTLVSSGLVYVQRIKFGEVIRNILIWTGIASILLLCYAYRIELSHVVHWVSGKFIPEQAIVSEMNAPISAAGANGHFM